MPHDESQHDDQSSAAQDPPRAAWIMPVLIALSTLALVVGVFVVQSASIGSDAGSQASASGAPSAEGGSHDGAPDLSGQEARDPDDLLAEGSVDAPVVMVMFTDYQCPFCAHWHYKTLPELREYVDRGELRIEYRDANVYGEDSERAARASLAAAMQGHYQEFQDIMFADGQIRYSDELTESALLEVAAGLGLDVDRFEQDMNSQEVADVIDANVQQAVDIGATATPIFIVDGTLVVGGQSADLFTEMIDEALAEAA